jgi:hypothetical protein
MLETVSRTNAALKNRLGASTRTSRLGSGQRIASEMRLAPMRLVAAQRRQALLEVVHRRLRFRCVS